MKCKIEIRANDAAFDKWEVVINGQVLAAGQTEPEAIRIAATIKSVLDYLECPDCADKDRRIEGLRWASAHVDALHAFVKAFDEWRALFEIGISGGYRWDLVNTARKACGGVG